MANADEFLDGKSTSIDAIIDAAADEHGVPRELAHALFTQESSKNPRSVNQKTGAAGLGNLIPATAQGLGVTDIFDPEQNARGSMKYLREGMDKKGNVRDALRYYYGGPDEGKWGKDTNAYPDQVLGRVNPGVREKWAVPDEAKGSADDFLGEDPPKRSADSFLDEPIDTPQAQPPAPVGDEFAAMRDAAANAQPTPAAPVSVVPSEPAPVGDEFTMLRDAAASGPTARKKTGSVTDLIPEAPRLGPPVRPEVAHDLQYALATATPEQKKAILDRPDYIGQYAALNEPGVAARAEMLRQDALKAGATPEAAKAFGERNAVVNDEDARKATFDFDTAAEYKDASILSRGVAKGVKQLSQSAGGILQLGADVLGLDATEIAEVNKRLKGEVDAIGDAKTAFAKNLENAISSTVVQLPGFAAGIVKASTAIPLMFIGAQSLGQEYSDGLQGGLTKPEALTRASYFASFEVIGELVGMPSFGRVAKAMFAGQPPGVFARLVFDHIKKEQGGELLTTTMEDAFDKFAPMGMRKDMTWEDYFEDVRSTIIQTAMQSVMLGGAGFAGSRVAHAINSTPQARAEQAREAAMNAWQSFGDTAKANAYNVPAESTGSPVIGGASVDGRPTLVTPSPAEGTPVETAGNFKSAVARAKALTDKTGELHRARLIGEQWTVVKPGGQNEEAATPQPERVQPAAPADEAPQEEKRAAPAGQQDGTVDEAAHAAATSPKNDKAEPTKEQILSGNAELGHPKVAGMDLSIENPAGSVREDKHNTPPKWRTKMSSHYGYIRGTVGFDKDHLDVFVKPGTSQGFDGTVYVVNQNKGNGHLDEHKGIIGAGSEKEARSLYLAHYEPGWESRIRSIVALPMDQFKSWAYDKTDAGPKGGELRDTGSAGDRTSAHAMGIAGDTPAETFTDFEAKGANPDLPKVKSVKTFKGEKQAATYAKSHGVKGYAPRKTDDGSWVLSKPVREPSEKQKAARAAFAAKATTAQPDDNVGTILGKAGGIRLEDLTKDGADPEDVKAWNKAHVAKPARENGKLSIDAAAEVLAGYGFDVYDEAGRIDASKAREIIDQELMGEKVYSPEGMEIRAARDAKARAKFETQTKPADRQQSGYNDLSDDQQAALATVAIDDPDAFLAAPEEFDSAEEISDEELDRWQDEDADGSPAPDQAGAEARGAQSRAQDGQADEAPRGAQLEAFDLSGETESEIRTREARAKKEAEAKAKRETAPDASGFTLTGSNSPADLARAHGQRELAPAEPKEADSFTVERLVDGEMTPITFTRGQWVSALTVVGADQHSMEGEIVGISHARKEAKVRDPKAVNGDGQWFNFGRIYAAERPAEKVAPVEPLAKSVEKSNKKNEPPGGFTEADRVLGIVEKHDALMAKLRDGEPVSVEEFKKAFQARVNMRPEIEAELKKATKEQLKKRLPGGRYANESKDQLVKAAYNDILSDFTLGEPYTYSPFGGDGGMGGGIRAVVDKVTAETIANYAKRVAEQRAEYAKRLEGYKKSLTDPQTLEEFTTFLRMRKESDLTPEQRARYDELRAEKLRGERQVEQERKATVTAAGEQVSAKIIETKHTRDGYDLFVVQLSARVSPEDYKKLLTGAKKMGGWYSSFKGNGAVPGFQFKDRASAEAFEKLAAQGDTEAVKEQAVDRREDRRAEKKNAAAERLSEMADKMEEKADEELGRDRLTNTNKRAMQASSSEAKANANKAMAKTLRNLAEAIESGKAKHLEGIRTRAQVEELDASMVSAKHEALRKEFPSYSDYERNKDRPFKVSDVEYAKWPSLEARRGDLLSAAAKFEKIPGAKTLAGQLRRQAELAKDDDQWHTIPRSVVETAIEKSGSDTTIIPWHWPERVQKINRLGAAGIVELPVLRAALREYVEFRAATPKADRVKELERSLAGNKGIGFDFFPTPEALANRMVEALDVKPGMRVLEPSAGKGNLADAVLKSEPDAKIDTVEQSSTLREILDAKGYSLVGHDFNDFAPAEKYDRIIMNPPFSNGIDADHVRRAFDMLKPGGRLVAITGEGIFFRDDQKSRAFRDWFDQEGGESEKLEGAFTDRREVKTTGAASRMLILNKEAPAFSRQADNLDALKFEKGTADNGLPAFKNGEVALDPQELENTYTLVDEDGRPEGKAQTITYRIMAKGEHVGYLRTDVNDLGDFLSVKLIEIKKNLRQEGRGLGETVLASMLASNHPSTTVEIIDIVVVRPEDEIPGEPLKDARGFWKKMGTRWRNYSSDPTVQMDGFITRADYLRARKGVASETARQQVPDTGRQAPVQPGGEQGAQRATASGARQTGPGEAAGKAAGDEADLDFTKPGLRRTEAPPQAGLPASEARRSEVEKIARKVTAAWRAPVEVVVGSNWQDERIPQEIRDDELRQREAGAEGMPDAVYWRGRIYLVASEVSSPARVVVAVAHEGLGHFGMRKVFGKALNPILDDLWAARRAEVMAKAKQYGQDTSTVEGRRTAAEEVLAEMAETQPQLGFVKRLLSVVRSWLREMGMNLTLSDDELVREILKPARDYVLTGQKGEAKTPALALAAARVRQDAVVRVSRALDLEAPAFHTAYHGTPHDFDRFSTEHIGTGEGAQAYGWGLYFSGKQEVAEHYRKSLAPRQWAYNGEKLAIGGWGWKLADTLTEVKPEKGESIASALKKAISRYQGSADYMRSTGADAAAALYESRVEQLRALDPKKLSFQQGRLYEVELAPKEEDYLDWDKPISQQSEKVRGILGDIGFDINDKVPGEDAYHTLAGKRGDSTFRAWVKSVGGGTAEGASRYLRSMGIPGIRYLDGGSRNQGPKYEVSKIDGKWRVLKEDGGWATSTVVVSFDTRQEADAWVEKHTPKPDHNYVIFDDADVTVKAKFARRHLRGNGRRTAHDFVTPEVPEFDGNTTGDLAYIEKSGRGVDPLPIRVVSGQSRGAHRGFGMEHLGAEVAANPARLPSINTGDLAEDLARDLLNITRTASSIHVDGNRFVLVSRASNKAAILQRVADAERGDYYSVVTTVPAGNVQAKWGSPIWAGQGLVRPFASQPGRAPDQSPGRESLQPDRQSFGAQTEKFQFEPVAEPRQEAPAQAAGRDVPVTIKKRRTPIKGGGGGGEGGGDGVQSPLFSRPAPWYSALERSVEGMTLKSAPAKQWSQAIENLTAKGVKRDEIEWSGVKDWLATQDGKVTQQQVVDFLKGNGVQVGETILGENGRNRNSIIDHEKVRLTSLGFEPVHSPDGHMVGVRRLRDGVNFSFGEDEEALGYGDIMDPDVMGLEAYNTATNLADLWESEMDVDDNEGATRFDKYTLPGGENYREVLLTLPVVARDSKGWQDWRDELVQRIGGDRVAADEVRRYAIGAPMDSIDMQAVDRARSVVGDAWINAYRNVLKNAHDQAVTQTAFHSSHFDEPNIVAHLRVDDRTDAQGKRILFIQEIQSDWAQRGKREGFNVDGKGRTELPPGHSIHKFTNSVGTFYQVVRDVGDGRTGGAGGASEQTETAAIASYWEEMARRRVPAAPFVQKTDAWVALAVKRAIRMAVDGGYDGIAWTTGKQQADRYGLDKSARAITVAAPGGVRALNIELISGGAVRMTIGNDGMVQSATGISGQHVEDKHLSDVIGKEMAERVMKARDGARFEGDDLRVGGKGMMYFYDQIVPGVVRDVLKKMGGGQVGDVVMVDPAKQASVRKDSGGDAQYEEMRLRSAGAAMRQPGFYLTADMKAKASEGMPMFHRPQLPGVPPPAGNQPPQGPRGLGLQGGAGGNRSTFNAPGDPGHLDNLIYTLQDKHVDTKRVLQAIKAQRQVLEAHDPYLQEELYHGRSARRVESFIADELKPLFVAMAQQGVTLDDFEKFLHARHAPEANAQIARVNPQLPDGGSGMLTADANAYIASIPAGRRAVLNQLAARVDAMVAGTRNVLVAYQLESPDTISLWQQAYQHYVPLTREDMEQGSGTGMGQGFSVKGDSSKRRVGSQRNVVNIIASIAMQREKAIVRGEKNRVANALVGLAMLNPHPGFWKVDKPPIITRINKQTGLVEHVTDPRFKMLENVIVARSLHGTKIIEHAVIFNERDERAARMAKALKNLDMDDLGTFYGFAAKITRYFASINTQYNPIFGVVNLVRDIQTAMVNLTSTPLAGKQPTIAAGALSALRGIYIDIRDARRGVHPTSAWARLWEEFQNEGGKTGYRDQFRTSDERAEAIQGEFAKMAEGRLKSSARAVFDWLSDFNDTMENSTRLAAYKAARDAGMSKQQAASLAKNLTVNFNRKGQISGQVGALYAFFNASTQGTARMIETLKGPAGAKIIAGGLLLGVIQALALMAAGFDDGEPPDFVKERNLIIPVGDKRYLTVPLPLGLHIFPNLGRLATELYLGGFKDVAKKATSMFSVTADAFNPLGSSGLSMQLLSPTALDPVAALAQNVDWTGKAIAKADTNPLKPTPGHTRAKDTATAFSKWLSKSLNWLSGGTDFKPGAFSPTPDQIDYLIGQVMGGVGREVSKVWQTAGAMYSGEDLPTHKIPLAGRFYGDAKDQNSQATKFYDNLKAIGAHELEIKGRKKAHEPVDEYRAENPESRLIRMADRAREDVTRLHNRKRKLEAEGAPREEVKALETRITERMQSFNDRVKEVRAEARP